MVAINQIVDEHVFRYRTEGVDDVRAKTDALAKAQGALAKSSDTAAASGAGVEKGARAQAGALGGLGGAASDAARMQAALDRAARQSQAAMVQAMAATQAYDQSLQAIAQSQIRAAQTAAQASAQQVKAANDNAQAAKDSGSILIGAAKLALEHPFYTATGVAAATAALSRFAGLASASLATASVATARYAAESTAAGSAAQKMGFVAADGLLLASRSAATAGTAFTGLSGKALGLASVFSPTGGMIMSLLRGLGALPAVLAASAVGIGVLGAAAVAGAAAVSKAYDDLGKLTDLAARAEKLDVGAVFLKSFTDLGPAIRASSDEMQSALQRASAFVQDRLGQQNQLAKAFADLQAGGYTGGSPLAAAKQLETATTTEQRIRAALAGMAELEARGQRLAALDLSEKVFGTAVTERLRTGQTSVEKIASELARLGDKQLFTDADARRALELSRAIEDTKRLINEAVESTFDFSNLAMKLDGIWLGILRTVLAVAEAGNKSADNAAQAIIDRKVAVVRELEERARQMEAVALPEARAANDNFTYEETIRDIAKVREAAKQLQQTFGDLADAKIDKAVGDVGPPARLVTDELARLAAEAANVTSTIPGVAGALQGLGGSAAAAAQQIASVAAGIRAIQGLNPDLSGVLGYFDKVKQVNAAFDATRNKALADFDKDGNAETAARGLNNALAERAKALKAISDQQNKPANDYIRSGELAQMNDLDRSVAQLGDSFARVKKERETFYEGLASQAATPEAAAAIRQQADAEIAKLDSARKSLEAKARADAAAKAATSAGSSGTGSDAFDNALQRLKDQSQELKLQAETAGKASEEVYKLTEANRLRRAAQSAGRADEEGMAEAIDRASAAYARQRKATEDALEAQQRLQEGTRELGQSLTRFLDDFLLGTTSLSSAFASMARGLTSSGLQALLTGQGPLAGMLGTAPTERGQVGGLLGGITPSFLRDAVRDGARTGTEAGASRAVADRFESVGVSCGEVI